MATDKKHLHGLYEHSLTKIFHQLSSLVCLCLCVSCLISPHSSHANNVPPGFGSLLSKQTTILDIYFGGLYLTSQLAEFNSNEVTLSHPDEIVEQIPDLLDSETVLKALQRPLISNAEYVCHTRKQINCGVLNPEIAGIIFDENRFRIDLFINKNWLALRELGTPKFLPKARTGLTFLQTFTTAFSGDHHDPWQTYTLNTDNILSYRESHVLLNGHYTNDEQWSAEDLLLRRDFKGKTYQLGLFRSHSDTTGLIFIDEYNIRGLRMATTLHTRTDLKQSTGSDLSVFLVNRSRVSLFKEGRLLSARVYDAGNQLLDTSRLPTGAYPVQIRIQDLNGNITEETRFYIKNSRFPPKKQILYDLSLGETTQRNNDHFLPISTGATFAKASISKRLADHLGIKLGAANLDNDTMIEVGIDHIGSAYELQTHFAQTREHSSGLSVNGRVRWSQLTLSAHYRETRAHNIENDDSLRWMKNNSKQNGWSLGLPLFSGHLNIMSRQNRDGGNIDELRRTHSVQYQHSGWQLGKYRLNLNLQLSDDDTRRQFLATTALERNQDQHRHALSHQNRHERLKNRDSIEREQEIHLSADWRHKDAIAGDTYLRVQTRYQESDYNLSGNLQHNHPMGEVDLSAEYIGENKETLLDGYLASSFVISQGSWAFGDAEQSQSAVIINLTGKAEKNYFDILVNGIRRGHVTPNRNTLITLQPFKTYRIELQAKGEGFVDFEQSQRTVTLYPGNVATLSWDISPVNIVLGYIVDQRGEAVANALLKGVAGLATTDNNGFFQASLKYSTRVLEVETYTHRCQIPLPDYQVEQHVGFLETLICELNPK